MIKTSYQAPEIRNANDEIVQEGAFGKNTALSNSTNDGWIDYVVNNLEALHDTIGDSAAHLDGNGHVVEPANLAIGDEDGNRLKTSYLKLTGGTVSGTLNVAQNLKFQDNQENVFGGVYVPSSSATEQYAQFYGGESTGVAGAKLTLYHDGDGRFKLDARSTDGSNTYTLVTDNNGNLNWRGYPLAWKKDYLPLSGGVLSGYLQFSGLDSRIISSRTDNDGAVSIYGGHGYSTAAFAAFFGINHATNPGHFYIRAVTDGSNFKELRGRPDGTLTWGGKNIERIESSGTNYIRYVSGLQICWGINGSGTGEARTISFPVAYSAAPVVVASPRPNSIATTAPVYMVRVSSIQTTSFDIAVSDATGIQAWLASWIAIGWWK